MFYFFPASYANARCGDENLPTYIEFIINHDEDPYEATSGMAHVSFADV